MLAIDAGAVNTAGMLGGRLVTVDGAPWVRSLVHGNVVGADAMALSRGRAVRGSPATMVSRMVDAARAMGRFDELVLADADAVVLAAARALAPVVRSLSSVLALAAGVAPKETVLVVDVGGSGARAAVVRRRKQLTVLKAGRIPTGGLTLDARIVDRLRPSLRTPADPPALHEAARVAKETLSRHDSTEIVLPDHRAVRLDRTEFERLIESDVLALLALVQQTRTPECRRVVLSGGTSRVPLVARTLAESTGLPVDVDPEPETAVVRGAHALRKH